MLVAAAVHHLGDGRDASSSASGVRDRSGMGSGVLPGDAVQREGGRGGREGGRLVLVLIKSISSNENKTRQKWFNGCNGRMRLRAYAR